MSPVMVEKCANATYFAQEENKKSAYSQKKEKDVISPNTVSSSVSFVKVIAISQLGVNKKDSQAAIGDKEREGRATKETTRVPPNGK
ncbi:hypothetical protein POVWA2_035940 [Plasmodium ovale wallikeri]|uniref:Uncharacterized protein n=1 Tax=Plasmodium ovale wallikeri TaxID=864142 RepID=A0A1A8Z3N1_PLAOA|nr:hypothetical protein POVWA1_036640 [Plasmodium ovale wallikeri]SBT38480.1 hypothetical protein POVWA2_035940 [Plasmodium ovale wallikeri]